MKRRIEELINDTYIYQAPKLVLSDTSLELTAPADSSLEGEFFFSAEDNSRIRGMLISSNRRIVLEKDTFSGNAIHVHYIIDTRGLKDEETFSGEITILSPVGEACVSVRVRVQTPEVQTRHGEIRNLEGFAKLARTDFREAFRLFNSPDFLRFLKGKDSCWLPLYRGLCAKPSGYQHLEEFLIACGRKEPVHISLDRDRKVYDGLRSSQKNILYVEKDTWGYVRMDVEVQGAFLQVDKKVITSEDFIGSLYGLEYILRRDRLRPGRNFGKIRISTVYETLEFEVTASNGAHSDDVRLKQKKYRAALMDQFVRYDTGAQTAEEWKKNSLELIQAHSGEQDYFSCVCMTAVQMASKAAAEAISSCWPIKNEEVKTEDPELKGLGLYLLKETGLLDTADSSICDRLYDLRMFAPKSAILLRLWMSQMPDFTPEKKLSEYEKLSEFGSRSPVMYSEVLKILKENPQLLTGMNGLYMRTMMFAARRGLLTPELTKMAAILAQHAKEWSPSLYRLLCSCYMAYPDREILHAILKQIMMETPGRTEYFVWYERAVEAQIRMTRLYEYYMETLPLTKKGLLPLAVRLYFSYENGLRSGQKALLYANIVQNREQDPATYEKYQAAMAEFTVRALERGLISERYAILYQHFIQQAENRDMAELLAEVMFTCKVSVKDRSIRQVIVINPCLSKEESYPVKDQTAYIQMYSGDEQILFEDSMKHRFAVTVEHRITPLMSVKKYVDSCQAMHARSFGLLVHTLIPVLETVEVSEGSIRSFLRIAEDDRFVDECRLMARTKALQYYTRNEDKDLPEAIQKLMAREEFAGKCKGLIVRAMLQRHKLAGAFDVISRYGYEYIDNRLLVSLCSQLIESMGDGENEELLCLAYELFIRGKANDTILVYLRDHYIGSLDQMNQIRDSLADLEIDTADIDEELLILSMFLRKPLKHPAEILESYMKKNARPQVSEAFLVFSAFDLFCADQLPEKYIIEQMKTVAAGEHGHLVCSLALLKYYAALLQSPEERVGYGWKENKTEPLQQISDEDKEFIRGQLEIVTEKGIRLGFFKYLPEELIQAYELDDRSFVEAKGKPGESVTIRYCLRAEGEKKREFRSEPMKEMFQGVFAKEFMLFYGEVLEYTLIRDNKMTDLTVHTISGNQIETRGKTKYQMLNRMLSDWHVQNFDQLDQDMKEYLMTDHICKEIFTLL